MTQIPALLMVTESSGGFVLSPGSLGPEGCGPKARRDSRCDEKLGVQVKPRKDSQHAI